MADKRKFRMRLYAKELGVKYIVHRRYNEYSLIEAEGTHRGSSVGYCYFPEREERIDKIKWMGKQITRKDTKKY